MVGSCRGLLSGASPPSTALKEGIASRASSGRPPARSLAPPLLAAPRGDRKRSAAHLHQEEEEDSSSSDQVIREKPASRGTETSAEVLVGPPLGAGGWSETPVNSSGTRLTPLTLALGGGLEGPPRPAMAPHPFPSASSVGVGRRRGSTWVRQLVRPESRSTVVIRSK